MLMSPHKKLATPSHIHVLPVLIRRGSKVHIFKKFYVCAIYFVHCYRARYVVKVLILWS